MCEPRKIEMTCYNSIRACDNVPFAQCCTTPIALQKVTIIINSVSRRPTIQWCCRKFRESHQKCISDRSSWQSSRLLVWTCQLWTRHVPCAASMHRRCAVGRNCQTVHLWSVGAARKFSPWHRLVNGCANTAIKPSLPVWKRWMDEHTVFSALQVVRVKARTIQRLSPSGSAVCQTQHSGSELARNALEDTSGTIGIRIPVLQPRRQCQNHHTSDRNPTSAASTNAQD